MGIWGRHLFAAEAGEGGLILSVDVRGSLTTATATTATITATVATVATEVATATTTALASATATTIATAFATTSATATTTAGTLGLNESGVEVDGLLDLALSLTLLLAAAASKVVFLFLVEGSSGLPLLVKLGAFIGGADLKVVFEGKLLLSLLSEVVGV